MSCSNSMETPRRRSSSFHLLLSQTHMTCNQSLDLGVHRESEDEPGMDEGAPGAELLDSNDDMDEDNGIRVSAGSSG